MEQPTDRTDRFPRHLLIVSSLVANKSERPAPEPPTPDTIRAMRKHRDPRRSGDGKICARQERLSQTATDLFGIRRATRWHRRRKTDDAMIRRRRKPMTTLQLKRSIDRRFDRIDRRFDKLDRQKADRSDLVQLRTELREEIARSAEETRRHMDLIAEGLRDDLRIFADAIGLHSERLKRHDTRLDRLEQRSFQG